MPFDLGAAEGVRSRYRIERLISGFRVWAPGRGAAIVTWTGDAFAVINEAAGLHGRYGCFQVPALLSAILRALVMRDDPEAVPVGSPFAGCPHWRGCSKWEWRRVRHAIAGRVREAWAAEVDKIDPRLVSVHRAVHAASGKWTPLASAPAVYADPYAVRDVVRYRAAALALLSAESRARESYRRRVEGELERSAEMRALKARAAAAGFGVAITEPFGREAIPPAGVVREFAAHWRRWYSVTGEPYRSLNRTLDAFPPAMPQSAIAGLAGVFLERPIWHRTELLVAAVFGDTAGHVRREGLESERGEAWWRAAAHCVVHADRREIASALGRVGAFARRAVSVRRTRDLSFLVGFLTDAPARPRGSIVGWADEAIAWHRDRLAAERVSMVARYGAEQRLLPPALVLPAIPGVEPLATVGAVVAEGARMDHCVARYVPAAVAGRVFLFHVTRAGEHATVMVGRDGEVQQAHGPRNGDNGAARWGARVLGRWGAGLVAAREATEGADDGDRGPF